MVAGSPLLAPAHPEHPHLGTPAVLSRHSLAATSPHIQSTRCWNFSVERNPWSYSRFQERQMCSSHYRAHGAARHRTHGTCRFQPLAEVRIWVPSPIRRAQAGLVLDSLLNHSVSSEPNNKTQKTSCLPTSILKQLAAKVPTALHGRPRSFPRKKQSNTANVRGQPESETGKTFKVVVSNQF